MGRMGGMLSYFTRHGTAANLLLVLMIGAGIWAFPNMRAQFFPDVVVDSVNVNVSWEGAGAEDIDRTIVELMEPTLLAIEGVMLVETTSIEGLARMQLEFEPGWDMSRAADDVASAVDTINDLPDEAEEPEVRRGNWRDRVTDVVITGPVGVEPLGRLADELVARLYAEGITRATIRGVVAPEVLVEVPSFALIRNDVTLQEISAAIAGEAEVSPAGDVDGANARVRTGVAKRSPDQIADIVIRTNPDRSQLTVGDVARIEVGGIDRVRTYFKGENPAISIRVDRSPQGDAIAIQEEVEAVVAEMVTTVPQGVEIDLIRTRSESIEGRLNILIENGLTGLALVVGLLFLFLNARTALWVAMGIPVAMFAAIFLMWAAGLTLNMISMFAMLITLGIVVDDAIVVGEHADFRARRLREDPTTAAENAARRMAGPVFSATLTTVIAFSALTIVEGRFGDLIADIPFTVCVVLIASLIECFLILPNHMAHSLAAAQRKTAWYDWPSRVVNVGFDWFRRAIFRRVMQVVIWARYPVLAVMLALLAMQSAVFLRGDVQWRFFSAPEEGSVSANFIMLPTADRADSLEQVRSLQVAVEELGQEYEAEFGRNPVAYALAEIGGNTGRGLSGAGNRDADHLGSIAVELIDPDLRPYSSSRFVRDLQDRVERHPLVETLSFRRWGSGPGGDSLDVQFYGASSEALKAASEDLKAQLAQIPEVSAVEDDMPYDKEELVLDLTAQGAALGFTIDDLGRTLRGRLNGIEAATFPDGGRSASIRVELPDAELTADFMDRMLLRTPDGAYVPLADIVDVTRRTGFSTIERENGLRMLSVTGEISEDDPARAEEITLQLRERILPDLQERFSVGWNLSGLAEQEQDFLTDALFGFVACLVGIYLVLAWVFSSWVRPLLIMAVIPFGLIGTIYGHVQWELPLSMFTVVGLIGMTGIIINDSIVLVTTVDEYSEERGLMPAIVDATADRLRPVFLTTLTTVIGLTPLLYEPSSQAQFLKPTVITLIYGLGFGMFIVLLMVPALLAMQQDIRRQFMALRRALSWPAGGRVVALATVVAVAGVLAIFAATLGHAILVGGLWPPLAAALGTAGATVGMALPVFLGLVLLWLMALFALAIGIMPLIRAARPVAEG
ncbi:efflux RND transporter permease subunit [Actibacterium sp. 188UL27-1]|uniref:efflux RND transporter permease subunit n=1 Tax=Actibacterium sp. 188UL27-1 TaxID=2786961 RepID=UPI00195E58BC|nr:efflux RND transporter permease subunit [Actibacterium sp. 188UL27-1]MBM7066043.1 efflux RND transporter permease subunit [Actibacterium sp. 188UL27-1]